MSDPTILIAEDNIKIRQRIISSLFGLKIKTMTIPVNNAIRILNHQPANLIIIGSSQDCSTNSLNIAKKIRKRNKEIPIILFNEISSEERAIKALRIGVNDYFKMDFSNDELLASVLKNLKMFNYHSAPRNPYNNMVYKSTVMYEINNFLDRIAATDSTVLITGESGTGKELAANYIHHNSLRSRNKLININCAALPDSLFESELFGYERGAFTGAHIKFIGKLKCADGGTVLLDEVCELSPFAQAKILRVIENKEIYRIGGKEAIPLNIRFISATNKDPEKVVAEGKFRKDLYFRLNVARVHMPSLRKRKEDIPSLLYNTIQEFNIKYKKNIQGLEESALLSLMGYDWPGNIRELKNLLEVTFINNPSDKITIKDLPQSFRKNFKEVMINHGNEKDRLLSALYLSNWNKSRAAEKLRWSRMTLYRKMNKYRIVTSTMPKMSSLV